MSSSYGRQEKRAMRTEVRLAAAWELPLLSFSRPSSHARLSPNDRRVLILATVSSTVVIFVRTAW